MQYYDNKTERFFAPTDLPRTAGGELCFLGKKTEYTSKESIDSWEGIYEKKEASDEKADLEQFSKFVAKEPELYVYHRHIFSIVNSLGDGAVALEIGCGTASMALMLNHYHRVWCYGVDISNQAVSRARERFSLLGEDPDLLSVADVTKLPFADGALNLIFGKTVFEHFEDPEMAAAEIARVLVPGGHLVLDVPNKRNSYWTFASERARCHTHTTLAYTIEDLSDFFLRQGFEVCSTWGDGLIYTTPYILYRNFFKKKGNREIDGEEIGERVDLGKQREGGVTQWRWGGALSLFDSTFKKGLRVFNRMANRWGWANSRTGVLVGFVARKKVHREEIHNKIIL